MSIDPEKDIPFYKNIEHLIDPEKNLPFDGFIEYLKCNGFIIGVDHYLRLQAVLKTFGPDSQPEDLKYLLSPIFAKDKKEQEHFYRLFDSYFRIFVTGEKQKPEKIIEKTKKGETLIEPDMAAPRKWPYVHYKGFRRGGDLCIPLFLQKRSHDLFQGIGREEGIRGPFCAADKVQKLPPYHILHRRGPS